MTASTSPRLLAIPSDRAEPVIELTVANDGTLYWRCGRVALWAGKRFPDQQAAILHATFEGYEVGRLDPLPDPPRPSERDIVWARGILSQLAAHEAHRAVEF